MLNHSKVVVVVVKPYLYISMPTIVLQIEDLKFSSKPAHAITVVTMHTSFEKVR